MVVPTPMRLVSVDAAGSRWGSFLKAFLVSVCTALGVLMRTRLLSWGKNFPRCTKGKSKESEWEEKEV